MPSTGDYMATGLLKGLGQGGMKVAEMRYQRERDAAEHERKKSILSFGQDLSDKSREGQWAEENRRTTDERGHQAGLLEAEQGREDTQKKTEVVRTEDLPNGLQQDYNVYGEEIGKPHTRAKTTGEFAVDAAGIKAGAGGIKSADYKLGLKNLFNDAVVEYATAVNLKPEELQTMNDLMTQFSGPDGTFNETGFFATLGVEYPEIYEGLRWQRDRMAEYLAHPDYNQSSAVTASQRDWVSFKKKRADDKTSAADKAAKADAIAKDKRVYDSLETDAQKTLFHAPVNEKNAKAVAEYLKAERESGDVGRIKAANQYAKDLATARYDLYTLMLRVGNEQPQKGLLEQPGNAISE